MSAWLQGRGWISVKGFARGVKSSTMMTVSNHSMGMVCEWLVLHAYPVWGGVGCLGFLGCVLAAGGAGFFFF